MLIKYSTGTNKGKVRDRNEDNNTVINCGNNKFMIFAVADGMGGMDFGDIASSIAVDRLADAFTNCKSLPNPESEILKKFTEIFNLINSEIIKECIDKKSVTGMGTTLSVCLISDKRMAVSHMGDSRIYIIRKSEIKQVTKDHSYVEELIDCGRITREQAKTHPNRNIITRALGLDREIIVDIEFLDIKTDDRVLLCTDGLTNAVEDFEILEIIMGSSNPEEAVNLLIDKANERGGRDNITLQLLHMEG